MKSLFVCFICKLISSQPILKWFSVLFRLFLPERYIMYKPKIAIICTMERKDVIKPTITKNRSF